MNIAEELARQIARVTIISVRAERLRGTKGLNVEPMLLLMRNSLENAYKAVGSGDAIDILAAIKDLSEYDE